MRADGDKLDHFITSLMNTGILVMKLEFDPKQCAFNFNQNFQPIVYENLFLKHPHTHTPLCGLLLSKPQKRCEMTQPKDDTRPEK